MNCCLWLNGLKVRYAADIINNFDMASLRGYLTGGSLIRWLYANGGQTYAVKLEQTADINDINGRIEYAFGLREQLITNNKQLTITEVHVKPVIYNSIGSYGSYGSGGFGSGSDSGYLGGYGLDII